MKNHIVILGGMGPQASAKLHDLIIEKVGIGKLPDEFPMILHVSMPIPDFIASEEATNDAIRIIQDTTSNLPLDDAAAIGIACNTAHLLRDKLTHIPNHNFVSMIDAVVDTVQSKNMKRVGLLASPSTIRNKLYAKAFANKGIEVITPDVKGINVLNDMIHGVISNRPTATFRESLTGLAEQLIEKDVDVILLGCTELPLVGVDVNVPVVDSLSCLADALLNKHNQANSVL